MEKHLLLRKHKIKKFTAQQTQINFIIFFKPFKEEVLCHWSNELAEASMQIKFIRPKAYSNQFLNCVKQSKVFSLSNTCLIISSTKPAELVLRRWKTLVDTPTSITNFLFTTNKIQIFNVFIDGVLYYNSFLKKVLIKISQDTHIFKKKTINMLINTSKILVLKAIFNFMRINFYLTFIPKV